MCIILANDDKMNSVSDAFVVKTSASSTSLSAVDDFIYSSAGEQIIIYN